MKKVIGILGSFIVTLSSSVVFANVIELADRPLQIRELEIELDSKTQKLSNDANSICIPANDAITEAAEYVKKEKNAVKILELRYTNNVDAKDCPQVMRLKVSVQYLSR
ncbi:MAG: hypothetical protein ACLGGX_10610 [Bdellovibrionia bacterium]